MPSRRDQTALSPRPRCTSLLAPLSAPPCSLHSSQEASAPSPSPAPQNNTLLPRKQSALPVRSCPRLSFLRHHFFQYRQRPLAPRPVHVAMRHHAHRIRRSV